MELNTATPENPQTPSSRSPSTLCSACGQEWYEGVETECIKRGKCGFRAIRVQWVKAREVNSPGRWYWARISGIDEQEDVCPQVVFITIDDDGMSAPEWRVLFIGEDERTAKTLSYLDERGWEFMEIPLPNAKGVATPACTLKNDPTASTESPRPAC
jgi:hypothetical protein